MDSIVSFVTGHFSDIIAVLGAVVMTARLIVKITPTPVDDSFLDKVVTFLSHVGLKL